MSRAYQGGYVQLPASVILDRAIGSGPLRLWVLLVWFKGRNAKAWPSENTLADDLGVSVSTIKRWKADLLAKGYLSQQRRFSQSNMYAPCLPKTTVSGPTDKPSDRSRDEQLATPTGGAVDELLEPTQTVPPLDHGWSLDGPVDEPLTITKELTPFNQEAASPLKASGEIVETLDPQDTPRNPRIATSAQALRERIQQQTPERQDYLRNKWPNLYPTLTSLIQMKNKLSDNEESALVMKLTDLECLVAEAVGQADGNGYPTWW